MAEIQVQRVESSKPKHNKRELYAQICYHYGYKLDYVSKLPARDLYLLSKTANKMQAMTYINLTNIAAAPHTKKGSAIKKLQTNYKKVLDS
jgi:hypothetical protein